MPAASAATLLSTDRWLVLDKPAGWLTIPGRPTAGEASPVLLERATAEHGKLWVVHRLDRETSGVVLFARNEAAHREACGWFAKHQARKLYDALAAGTAPAAPVFKVNRPVEGAPSITQFETREEFRGAFLVRARLQTGRRHQIRIHLSEEGFPILGDRRYGGPEKVGSVHVGRVALHARRLELPGGESAEAPWPEDFRGWVEALKGYGA